MKRKRATRWLRYDEIKSILTNLERKHGHDAVRWAWAYHEAEKMRELTDTKDLAHLLFHGQQAFTDMHLSHIATQIYDDYEWSTNLQVAEEIGRIASYAFHNHGLNLS